MADVTLEQALPVVRNLAQSKANAFVRRFGFTIDEGEDIQSQLLLSFLSGCRSSIARLLVLARSPLE